MIRKFYDAAAGITGGAGDGLPPSLGDITGGSSTGSVTPPTELEDPTEGLNEDGSLQDGYERNAEGQVVKKAASTEDPKDDSDGNEPGDEDDSNGDEIDSVDPKAFFKDVDALRGETIEVEYPDGMDPMSPEGVYHREKVLEDRAVQRFEENLRRTDPRGYAYLLHRSEGGSDEEFLSRKSFSLPEYEEFKANADLHMKVYKSALLSKDIDEETAQAIVDKAIKDGKLFEKADQAYKAAQVEFEKELKLIEEKQQQEAQQYTESVNKLSQQLRTAVQEGKSLNLVIPDSDKPEFLKFLQSHVQFDKESKQFLFVQQIGEQLPRQIESLYLQYKKGDLSQLIQRAAQTQNTRRLGQIVNRARSKPSGAAAPEKPTGYVPLGSI